MHRSFEKEKKTACGHDRVNRTGTCQTSAAFLNKTRRNKGLDLFEGCSDWMHLSFGGKFGRMDGSRILGMYCGFEGRTGNLFAFHGRKGRTTEKIFG